MSNKTTTIETDTVGSKVRIITPPSERRLRYIKVEPTWGDHSEVALNQDNALAIIHALADAFNLDNHKAPRPSVEAQLDALAIGDQFTVKWDAPGYTQPKGIKVDADQVYSYSSNALKSISTYGFGKTGTVTVNTEVK